MTLAIAIVALLVACGAVLAAGRALRQVAMLAEAPPASLVFIMSHAYARRCGLV